MIAVRKCKNCQHYGSATKSGNMGVCSVLFGIRRYLLDKGYSKQPNGKPLPDGLTYSWEGRHCTCFKSESWKVPKKVAKKIGKSLDLKNRDQLREEIDDFEANWCVYCGTQHDHDESWEDRPQVCSSCRRFGVYPPYIIEGWL